MKNFKNITIILLAFTCGGLTTFIAIDKNVFNAKPSAYESQEYKELRSILIEAISHAENGAKREQWDELSDQILLAINKYKYNQDPDIEQIKTLAKIQEQTRHLMGVWNINPSLILCFDFSDKEECTKAYAKQLHRVFDLTIPIGEYQQNLLTRFKEDGLTPLKHSRELVSMYLTFFSVHAKGFLNAE